MIKVHNKQKLKNTLHKWLSSLQLTWI